MKLAALLLYICLAPLARPPGDSTLSALRDHGKGSIAHLNGSAYAAAPSVTESKHAAGSRWFSSGQSGLTDIDAYLHFHAEAKWGVPGRIVLLPWPEATPDRRASGEKGLFDHLPGDSSL